jgi:hypothetical protein
VSYDLAFWQGAPPPSDGEASTQFERIWDALEEPGDERPPTPVIQELVRELESRWPVDAPAAPWATFPLSEDALGHTLYVNLVMSISDQDVRSMADVARRLGIVCFDPQRAALL